jgi:hypothetical protein
LTSFTLVNADLRTLDHTIAERAQFNLDPADE